MYYERANIARFYNKEALELIKFMVTEERMYNDYRRMHGYGASQRMHHH
jgi:hypothetical protein